MQSQDKPSYNRTRTPIETSTRALQILKAADELLAERGHDGVSMRDVAQRAGVNKALIFYYFGSRAQLFEKVLERYYRNHAKSLARVFSHKGDPHERVRKAIDSYLDFVDTNPLYSRLVNQELARQDAQLIQLRENQSTLCRMVQEELAEILPEEGPLSPLHFFITFSGLVMSYHTYANALPELFDGEPVRAEALKERREHVQWVAETIVDRLIGDYDPS